MAKTGRNTLVIVEDHGIAGAGLQFMLAQDGRFEVLQIIHRGDRAEVLIRRLDPDLVILDIALPGKSGLAILEGLKQKGARPRILVLSGQAHGLDFKRAIDLGADGVLSKSDSPQLILQALAAIAIGARFISDSVRNLVGPLGEDKLANLTGREREVLVHMAEGASNELIARQLGIEVLTVKKHRQNLMRKLGVNTAVEASRKAYQLGLLILTQHE
ncbi:MAG: response regulator transcription factor [Alphaproteobacteria bacterium]